MEYRLKRQITIAGIFFTIVFFIVAISFVNKGAGPVSCFDGVKNQDETGVDCGGAMCKPCQGVFTEDIQVLSSNFILFNERYDAVAEVKNPNSQYGTSDLEYSFKFYDKDNNFISEKSGRSYILAGETKYIMENNFAIEGDPAYLRFDAKPLNWQEQKRTSVKLPVFSKKFENVTNVSSNQYAEVSGSLENQSNYSFVSVDVVAMLLDKNDNYIAMNRTRINNLRAGEKRNVSIPWFSQIDGSLVYKVVMEASADALDDSNILK